jgi:hypothetical protein
MLTNKLDSIEQELVTVRVPKFFIVYLSGDRVVHKSVDRIADVAPLLRNPGQIRRRQKRS